MASNLVTGGAGFIGSHVVDELIRGGNYVVVLDDLSGGRIENVNPEAEFVQGSVVDSCLVDRLFGDHEFEYVFHLAAYAAEGLSHFIKKFNYENNLIGSVNLINGAVNQGSVKCFVFTSSIAVYGSGQVPMTEAQIPCPEDSYGIAKMAVERELHITHQLFSLPFIIFRPHNVYGERQNLADPFRNVIGIFMNQAMRGQPFTIFGDGSQTRAFSHIADIAPIIADAIHDRRNYGEVFNIGADQPYTICELAQAVATAMDVEMEVEYLPRRFEVEHAFADHSKSKRAFGEKLGRVSLQEGLARMASWAKSVGPQDPRSFYGVEILKGLPPSWSSRIT